jgi:hypothetical protein
MPTAAVALLLAGTALLLLARAVPALGDDSLTGSDAPARRLWARPTDNAGSLRAFWEDANPTFAHIDYSGHLGSPEKLMSQWKAKWITRVAPYLRGARVVEYGIGAALLGQVLLGEYNVSHYTGLDISDRQLGQARERLSARFAPSRFTLLRVDELPDLTTLGSPPPTFFISQAVIQHFPSMAYYERFAARINAAPSITHAMLQIRRVDDNRNLARSGDRYTAQTNILNGVTFKEGELPASMPMFLLEFDVPGFTRNGYRFYGFVRRGHSCFA